MDTIESAWNCREILAATTFGHTQTHNHNRNHKHTKHHFILTETVWFTFAIFFHHCWLFLFLYSSSSCYFLLLHLANFPSISIALKVFSISLPFISLFASHRVKKIFSICLLVCLSVCLFVCSLSFTLRLLFLHINIALIQNTTNHGMYTQPPRTHSHSR